MSEKNRVVWSEGLFLRPQHFQQQDRYFEAFVEGRVAGLRSNAWGFTELEIDTDLLAIGTFAIRKARGVFPDGTPFAVPDTDKAPPPLEITIQTRDQVVSLALPFRQAGSTLIARGAMAPSHARYRARVAEARDVSVDSGTSEQLETADLNLRLVLQSEASEDFARIPLAHIIECSANKKVILEERFIPTVLRTGASPKLTSHMSEAQGLLYQRAEHLAGRAASSGRGGTAEISDFLMLQAVNRYDPWVTHLSSVANCHPEDFYILLLQAVGELSTLAAKSRRPPKFPSYQHGALRQSFEPVMSTLRELMSAGTSDRVVEIPLESKGKGYRVGIIHEKSLLDSAVFILAARADLGSEDFRRLFLARCKVAPQENIGHLVRYSIAGIGLQALPTAPRQLHPIAGSHYFEMQRGGELWQNLKSSAGLVIHVSDEHEFPGLAMECWAIRG